jgi:Carboxypeptidase regulatory-like domain
MMLFAFLLASVLDTATVRMSLDVQEPARASRITVTLTSLRDAAETVAEQPWSSLDKLEQLSVAPGSYEMTIAAPHHQPVTRHVIAAPGETVALGTIALRSLPELRGIVKGIAGATVRTDEAETKTDRDGRFALELGARRPKYVIVDAPRRGSRVIDVPVATADVELPPIELGPPSSVQVTVTRPANTPVEVLVGSEFRGSLRWIAKHNLGAKESKATFATLAPGTYTLLVRGRGPLQQHATRVTLGTNDRRRTTLAIEPHPLELRVTLNGAALPKANVILLEPEHDWMTRFDTDERGRWRGEVWQRGAYVARVKSPSMQALSTVETRIDGPELVLDLPSLTVRGRVVDDSGAPIAKASVSLRSEWADSSATAPLQSDADGRFAFRGVPEGRQKLTVRAPGFLLTEPVRFELAKEDRDVEVRLQRGVRKTVVVRDSHSAPIAGASVFCGEPERIWSSGTTTAEGHAAMSLPPGGCVLYVIPDGMSFAMTRATPRMIEDAAALPVYAGGATGRLEVSMKTVEGAPVGGVRLLVRYNGDVLPADVVRVLERVQGLAFRTDDGGVATLPALPLGTYEMWPYRNDREAENILAAGSLFEAPITLTLKTGENQVAVKLRAR